MSAISLGFVFTGRDLASRTFSKVDANFGRLERNTRRSSRVMQASMAAVGGGMAALAIGFVALKKQFDFASAAGRFQQQLVATSKIMIDGTENLRELRNTALDVGLRTPFAPEEIMTGLRSLAELGFKSAEAISTIEPAANLAVLGQIKLDKASKAIAGTLRAFNMEATESGNVADRLGLITQQSGFQAVDFANGLSKGAATMGRFGQSLEDTLVLMGAMRDMNIRANVASTNMREATRRVFSQQSAVNKLRAAGIATLDAETGKRRRLVDILFDMSEHTKTLSVTQGDLFTSSVLGARGADMLTGVIRKGRESFDEDIRAMNNSAGTAQRFMDAMLDTFQGQKDLLRGAAETFKVVVGEAFADTLKPVIRFMVESIGSLTRIIRDLPGPLKKAGAGLLLLSTVMFTLAGGAMLFAGAMGMAAVLLTTFTAATLGALVVFGGLVISVGLVTAGIVGLGAAMNQNMSSAGGIKKFWEDLKTVFDGVSQALSGKGIKGETMFKLIQKENEGLLIWVVNIVRWVQRAEHFFKGMWAGFNEGITTAKPHIDAFKSAFDELGKTLGIGTDKHELMTTSTTEAANEGAKWGATLAKVAVVGIKFMTAMVKLSDLLIDNFETLKNTLMIIAGIFVGRAFMRMGGMMGMSGGAAAGGARAAAGSGGMMMPMMMGGGGAVKPGTGGGSMAGLMGNSTPGNKFFKQDLNGNMTPRTPMSGIPLGAMPAQTTRERFAAMRQRAGGVGGMLRTGGSKFMGALPGIGGAAGLAMSAQQASEGNYGTALMGGAMSAQMIGKQGFKGAGRAAMGAGRMGVKGLMGAASLAGPIGLAAIAFGAVVMGGIELYGNKVDQDIKDLDKQIGVGANRTVMADASKPNGGREANVAAGSMNKRQFLEARAKGGFMTTEELGIWKKAGQSQKVKLDLEKKAMRDARTQLAGMGPATPTGPGEMGSLVRIDPKAVQLGVEIAMANSAKKGLLGSKVTIKTGEFIGQNEFKHGATVPRGVEP
jgi:TP901 family phage tail tape measure protein